MKQRLDTLLFSRGLCESRESGQRLIMAGRVYVDGQKSDKPGTGIFEDAHIEVRGERERYVSRGGYKLEQAMASFAITLDGCVCMDIGASTGGFCDCMLQNGALQVYAVDVGYGQLAVKLRDDARVVNLERQNIRHLDIATIEPKPQFISIDVSFISLSLVLPVAYNLLPEGGQVVALVKPQFEAGRGKVGKKGVVRDPLVHKEVLSAAVAGAKRCGFGVLGLEYSPIKGPQGNIEYLMHLEKGIETTLPEGYPDELVERSHLALD